MRVRRAAPALGAMMPSEEEIAQVSLLPEDPTPIWERRMNPEQLQVIRHESGPLCCLAAAGSGKTRAVVHRVARLVEHLHVDPARILCVTFSKKAAGEMDERVRALGISGAAVQTWHAFCYRVIRETPTREARWTLDEKNRAKTYVKQAIGYKHENWQGADLTKVCNFIGRCKANLWAPEDPGATDLARKMFGGQASRAVRVYAISQGLIEDAGILTFDDMLCIVARLFRDDEEARRSWAGKFDHVLTDEVQDNSRVQEALQEALARDHRNIMVVGDLCQCHPPGVMVEVSRAWNAGRAGMRGKDVEVPIETLRDGDTVMGWNRHSQKMVAGRRVKVEERHYSGSLHTMSVAGREVPMTPNHRVLARWTDRARDHYLCVTYLMWRADLGFRVGWCQVFSASGTYGEDSQCIVLHMAQRARIERAEKFWVLKVHQTRTEASVYESIIAAKYGIPTATFEPVDGAQHLTREAIDAIFGAVRLGRGQTLGDTNDWRGKQALRDHGPLDFDLPLYPWPGKTRDEIDLRQGRMTYFEVYASNLLPGLMSVPLPDGQNEWRPVDRVDVVPYSGPVYSLDVEEDHSYSANGVVVLNSLYSFRGAEPELLASFPAGWSAPVVTMHRNYRSGSEIVRVANEIIRPGKYRLPVDMEASREDAGTGTVERLECETLEDEAGEVVAAAQAHLAGGGRLSDWYVLVRLNAQSRALEDALLKARLPYVIVGGISFYERKEVKDLLAYLRVALGRDAEGDAIKRCINAHFRFLGAAFTEKLMDARAASPEAPLGDVLRATVQRAGIQSRQVASASEWLRIVEHVERIAAPTAEGADANPAGEKTARADAVLEHVVRATRYIEWLEKEEGEESVESSHAANVRELLRVAREFATAGELLDYIEKTLKESARQRKTQRGDVLTIMSIRRSKGLERPVVWVVGCNEGVLPHAKGDIEEERRIMYVAATRARDRLIVSHVREMATRAGLRPMAPSQFLAAFPPPKNRKAEDERNGENSLQQALGVADPAQVEPEERDAVAAEARAALVGFGVPVEIIERNPGSALSFAAAVEAIDPGDVAGAPRGRGWLGDGAECAECQQPVDDCIC